MHPSRTTAVALLLPLALPLAISGCRISTHSSDGKNNNDVKVATPFGGLQIKTDQAATQASVGLPVYPGATLVKKQDGHDDGAADVNIGFGSFQMRVKAISYRTPDDPDKVQAFYRNALRRYGDVIECVKNHPVGKPDHTAEGLSCDENKHSQTFTLDKGADKVEFKAGSEKHQHIASVERDNGGTKFGLIALDLPGHISVDSDDAQPRD